MVTAALHAIVSTAGHHCIGDRLQHALIMDPDMWLSNGMYVKTDQSARYAGKKLDQKVEQGIMASGVLLLTLAAVVLVVRDTINLGSGKSFM